MAKDKSAPSPYIRFDDMGTSPSGKTRIWYVVNTQNVDDVPGIIKWSGAWRKYVYHSGPAFYDAQCLRTIAEFIDAQMMMREIEKS